MSLPMVALALLAGAAPASAPTLAALITAQAAEPQLVVLPLEADGVKPELGLDAWKVVVAEVQKAKARLKVAISAQAEIHDIILGPAREQARDCGANLECLREIGSAIDASILVAGKVTKTEVSMFALDVATSQKLASGKSAAKDAGAKLEQRARAAAQALIIELALKRAQKKPDAVAEVGKTDGAKDLAAAEPLAAKDAKSAERSSSGSSKAPNDLEPLPAPQSKRSTADAAGDDLKSDPPPPSGKSAKAADVKDTDAKASAKDERPTVADARLSDGKAAGKDKKDAPKGEKDSKGSAKDKKDTAAKDAPKDKKDAALAEAKPGKAGKPTGDAERAEPKDGKGVLAASTPGEPAGGRRESAGGSVATLDARGDDLKLPSEGTIHVTPELLSRLVRFEIDGAEVARAVDGSATWTGAPGSHVVVAERDDGAKLTKNVVVEPGATHPLTLSFPSSGLATAGPGAAKKDTDSVTGKWWFWTAIAGAVVVGGATTVALAGGLKGGPDVPSSYGSITGTY